MTPSFSQFIGMLKESGTPYALFDIEYSVYVEVGRYAYKFRGDGNWAGGWMVGDGSPEQRKEFVRLLETGSLAEREP